MADKTSYWVTRGTVDDSSGKLLGLIIFRFVMVTVLFLASMVVNAGGGSVYSNPELRVWFSLMLVTYFISLIYLLGIRYEANYTAHTLVQLASDTVMWTILVYITGGIQSPFTFLYIISLIISGVLLGRLGILYTLFASSGLLLAVIFAQNYGWYFRFLNQSDSMRVPLSLEIFYTYFLNVSMLGLVGYWTYAFSRRVLSAESELRAQKRSYLQLKTLHINILENMDNGLIITDIDNMVVVWNKAMERLTGIPVEWVLGKYANEIAADFNTTQSTMEADAPFEVRLEVEDGKKVTLLMWHSPYLNEMGEKMGTMYIVDDVTAQRYLEQEMQRRERLAALGQLAAGIAHEIKNPLAGISGAIQMLARTGALDSSDDLELVDIIKRETERLNDLVNDFLTYARPPTLNLRETTLRAVIEETMPLFMGLFEEEGIALKWEPSKAADKPVALDRNQFQQILWNVVNNAKKAVARVRDQNHVGEVILSTASDKDSTGRKLVLVVSDNGPGIKEDLLAKIFDPFFTTNPSGTGLGLTIAYQLIMAHGGKIDVKSAEGKGTTILISFPLLSRERKATGIIGGTQRNRVPSEDGVITQRWKASMISRRAAKELSNTQRERARSNKS